MEVDFQASPTGVNKRYPRPSPRSSGKKWNKTDYSSIYKTSPRWLQNYRDKCLTELNHRRKGRQAKLLEQFRKLDCQSDQDTDRVISEVMRSVWCQMRTDDPEITDEDIHYHQLNLDNLEQELRREEAENELRYWESLNDEIQNELIADALKTQNNVPCVICHRNVLIIEPSRRIFCSGCDFCLPITFPITGEQLEDLIRQRLEEHDKCRPNCRASIEFSPLPSDLKITCQNCRYTQTLFNSSIVDFIEMSDDLMDDIQVGQME